MLYVTILKKQKKNYEYFYRFINKSFVFAKQLIFKNKNSTIYSTYIKIILLN